MGSFVCSLQLAAPIEVKAEGGLDAPEAPHNGVFHPNNHPKDEGEGITLSNENNENKKARLNGWKLDSSYFGVTNPKGSSFHKVAKFYADKNTKTSAGGEHLVMHSGHQAVAKEFHADKNNAGYHLQVVHTDGNVTYHRVANNSASGGATTEISSWAHPIAAKHAPGGAGLSKVAAGAHPAGVANSVAGNHPVPRK